MVVGATMSLTLEARIMCGFLLRVVSVPIDIEVDFETDLNDF